MNKKSNSIVVLLIGNQGTRIINIERSITGKKLYQQVMGSADVQYKLFRLTTGHKEIYPIENSLDIE